jgi:hypothetical protein
MTPTALPPGGPLTRRAAVLALTTGALSIASRGGAATLPAAGSLASALAAALLVHQPLLVLASTEGCAFCQLVRDNYLAPMQRQGTLRAIQLDLGSRAGVIDFAGNASTHDELLRRWHVNVAPTVLFFGRGGREAAPRLIGASPDFYSAYLEQRLDTARRQLG